MRSWLSVFMNAATRLVNARLQLLPLTRDDVDDLHRVFTKPGVRRYLWDDEVIERDVTAGIVDRDTEAHCFVSADSARSAIKRLLSVPWCLGGLSELS